MSSYNKEYYKAHKAEHKEYMKVWREANKDKVKAYHKVWKESNIDKYRDYQKDYYKADLNSLGQTKNSIRDKSRYYLKKYGKKIEGYEIHHCCTYDEPYKFIYCSKEIHRLIHSYLRQHNIDANSNHYKYIKHLLDDTVILYGI